MKFNDSFTITKTIDDRVHKLSAQEKKVVLSCFDAFEEVYDPWFKKVFENIKEDDGKFDKLVKYYVDNAELDKYNLAKEWFRLTEFDYLGKLLDNFFKNKPYRLHEIISVLNSKSLMFDRFYVGNSVYPPNYRYFVVKGLSLLQVFTNHYKANYDEVRKQYTYIVDVIRSEQ